MVELYYMTHRPIMIGTGTPQKSRKDITSLDIVIHVWVVGSHENRVRKGRQTSEETDHLDG